MLTTLNKYMHIYLFLVRAQVLESLYGRGEKSLLVGNSVLATVASPLLWASPYSWRSAEPGGKKKKRSNSEKVWDTGALAGESLNSKRSNLQKEIWQTFLEHLRFAFQFTMGSSLMARFDSFAKHKAVKLQKLTLCNMIFLPPFPHSCENNGVFVVFYLMCEIFST